MSCSTASNQDPIQGVDGLNHIFRDHPGTWSVWWLGEVLVISIHARKTSTWLCQIVQQWGAPELDGLIYDHLPHENGLATSWGRSQRRVQNTADGCKEVMNSVALTIFLGFGGWSCWYHRHMNPVNWCPILMIFDIHLYKIDDLVESCRIRF